MNETEYHMKNYGDRGVLTSREIRKVDFPLGTRALD